MRHHLHFPKKYNIAHLSLAIKSVPEVAIFPNYIKVLGTQMERNKEKSPKKQVFGALKIAKNGLYQKLQQQKILHNN